MIRSESLSRETACLWIISILKGNLHNQLHYCAGKNALCFKYIAGK